MLNDQWILVTEDMQRYFIVLCLELGRKVFYVRIFVKW